MGNAGLAATLADPALSGAYFIDRAEGLDEAAARLGFACATIDLSGCTGKAGVLARFAQALDFPDWFGGNWDALSDCLADLSWRPAPGYVLLLSHARQWREAEPGAFATLLEIAAEAADAWRARAVPFWLLVAADGIGGPTA